ncbi:MAG: bifunctional nuclease family protein [Nanoarchaeota archaeon]|nr:bifunctional nuclease family protein [Nanoarchaeota archaeon]
MRKYFPVPILLFLLGLTITYAVLTMPSEGYVEANVFELEGNIVIVGYDCKAIVAETSPERALSIQLGIEGKIDGRPTTHDTFVEVLKSYNITLESVRFTKYQDEFYYSDLIFNNGKKILELDAMPSDALALAVRLDAPIYINKTLLNEVGLDICQ